MSADYRIAETELAQASLGSRKHKRLAKKLAEYVYPQLRKNPHYGPNIKKLKGDLEEFWRCGYVKLCEVGATGSILARP